MQIRKILAAIPVMAVGMALWKHSLWVASPENFGGDGTVQALEESFYQLLSVIFFTLGALILFKYHFVRSCVRGFFEFVIAEYLSGAHSCRRANRLAPNRLARRSDCDRRQAKG